MKRQNKGKLLKTGRGIGQRIPCSRTGVIAEVILLPFVLLIVAVAFFLDWIATGFSIDISLLLFMLLIVPILAMPFVECGSMDALYENGFTVRHGMKIPDVLRGRHWFSWSEITRIEHGMTKGLRRGFYHDSGYFRVLTTTRSTHAFIEIEYRSGAPDEFYDLFWRKLWEQCGTTEWIERDITEGQWTGHPEWCR